MSKVTPHPLTRAEFSKFLPNQRAIRAFEELFIEVPNVLDEVVGTVSDLAFPSVLTAAGDVQVGTFAHVVVASVSGLTATLPKASDEIIGKVWAFTLLVVGTFTIETQGGDSFPTVGSPTETTAVLTQRGTTVDFRCISETQWTFA